MTEAFLLEQIKQKQSLLCVGLDPDITRLPAHLRKTTNPVFAFNKAIIDATLPYAIAYKPNLAFFEALGMEGLEALHATVEYLSDKQVMVIADAKRGDIGNTARQYARSIYIELKADAVTLSPYLGFESVKPFTDFEEKWFFNLALTSNSGANDFQLLESDGRPLFTYVLEKFTNYCPDVRHGFVVGATQSEYLAQVRHYAPEAWLLVPGIGAQGGNLAEVIEHLHVPQGHKIILNSARSILYASSGRDFDLAAARAAEHTVEHIRQLVEF